MFPKKFKIVIIIGTIYLVMIQTYDLNKWFYNDNLRYQEEKNTMLTVANKISSNFDITKPVVFIGHFTLSSNINYNQTNGSSLINWGMVAFGEPNTELFNFLQMNGYYFVRPTYEQLQVAKSNIENMNNWPKENSIVEYDNIIVVKF